MAVGSEGGGGYWRVGGGSGRGQMRRQMDSPFCLEHPRGAERPRWARFPAHRASRGLWVLSTTTAGDSRGSCVMPSSPSWM